MPFRLSPQNAYDLQKLMKNLKNTSLLYFLNPARVLCKAQSWTIKLGTSTFFDSAESSFSPKSRTHTHSHRNEIKYTHPANLCTERGLCPECLFVSARR